MGFLKTYVLTTQDGKFVCRTLECHEAKVLGRNIHVNGGFSTGACWHPTSRLIRIEGMGAVPNLNETESKALLRYSQDKDAREGIVPLEDVVLILKEKSNAAE